jgi:hypothetical protein
MAKRFDAVTRSILEKHPVNWAAIDDLVRGAAVDVINSDLSTLTTEADKVLRVNGPKPWLIHVEFQTRHDRKLPLPVLRYNTLLSYRHGLPVHSMAVLLHRAADGDDLDGVLRLSSPDGRCGLEFHYHVVRVWELDLENLLAGGIGTLPLAPLAASSEAEMPRIVKAMMQRVDPAATSADEREFWAASAMLASLRFPWESIKHWFQGVTAMQESSMNQGLLREGRAEEARRILFLQGEGRFGVPDEESRTKLESMSDVEQLERLAERILRVSSWTELLATS